MTTVLHYPNGTEQEFETEAYMIMIEALDSSVKVVDTWVKGDKTHFELAFKTTEELLEES